MRVYEYRHVVGFEETNLVGNVYYVNHLRWQGRCREMFLRKHAPGVLRALAKDLALATVRCSCDYLRELNAFDEIVLSHASGVGPAAPPVDGVRVLAADCRGRRACRPRPQEIACMRHNGGETVPTAVPKEFQEALRAFSGP